MGELTASYSINGAYREYIVTPPRQPRGGYGLDDASGLYYVPCQLVTPFNAPSRVIPVPSAAKIQRASAASSP